MPTYEAELSDGRIVTVQADKPPSESDILSAIGKAPSTPASAALTNDGLPHFNPTTQYAEPPPGEDELQQDQAHPLTAPIARVIPKISEELMGKAASFIPSIARDWYEALPDTRTSPDEPVKESLKEKALYALAGATPSDKAISIATGVQNAGADIGNFFTSPVGIATLGIGALPAAAQRAVAIGFAATMAKDVPKIATELGTELGKPEDQRDYKKIAELTANAVANTGFAALGAAHGAGKPIAEKLGAYPNESVTPTVTQEKGTENAIPERSATETVVGQTPGDSSQVGARVPGAEEPADAQGAAQTAPQTPQDIPNEVIQSPTPDRFETPEDILKFRETRRREAVNLYKQEIGLNAEEAEQLEAIMQRDGGTARFEKKIGAEKAARLEKFFEESNYNKIGGPFQFWEYDKRYNPSEIESFDKPEDIPYLAKSLLTATQGDVTPKSNSDRFLYAVLAARKLKELGATQRDLSDAAAAHARDNSSSASDAEEFFRTNVGRMRDFLRGQNISFDGVKKRGTNVAPESREAATDQTMHSMGGLAPSDPMEEAGRGGGDPDIYGIAQRVREQRALAGQVAEVPIGEGVTPQESIDRGRDLLKQDPTIAEKQMASFEADPRKSISADDIAAVRAKGEELAQAARRIEEKFGTESDEYKAAWKALSDWDTRSKPMQTEWHKIGMAQQGETDIDTGSFTGLQRAFKDATGKEFKPEQQKAAKQKAAVVSKAAETTTAAKQKVFEEIDDQSRNASAAQLKLDEQDKAAKRAFDAVNKTVREATVRAAEAENKARVADTALKRAVETVQEDAANRVQKAVNKTLTQAEIRAAREENKARVRKAAEEKAQAEKERADAQKELRKAQAELRKAAIEAARTESANRVSPERVVWQRARDYLDQGFDNFDDIRNKIATDLGISVDYATKLLGYSKRAKFLADDLWRKQQAERRLRQQAKQWLDGLDVPFYKKAIASVPKVLFSLKVGFHGTVALGTHAPMVAFQPRFWETYVRDFGKMYKMVGSKAYYERQVQDLLRRPNYTVARRAGLVNDPSTYEDFNSPDTSKYFGKVTGMGNRGYSVLKILRQDMFDQMWSKLPKTARIPEVAEAIADGLNHATGVVKGAAPKGANTLLFAPRLMASRAMWLAVDPIKAADIFARWKDAGPGEKRFAVNQIKEKAWVAGTLFAMLAINQGLLTAMDSDQKVNFTDPFKGDFLKFKAAGMTVAYGNAMLTMARLPVRLFKIRESDGGKLKNLVYPDEDTYTVLGEYGRSQLSPFASLALDLWLKSDWQRRPLPNSNRPVPKRLREKGEIPYTWPEFWSEQMLPIPAEEAAREVWRHGLGMSDDQIKAMRKAVATIAVMGATGARLTEDTDAKH